MCVCVSIFLRFVPLKIGQYQRNPDGHLSVKIKGIGHFEIWCLQSPVVSHALQEPKPCTWGSSWGY